MAVRKALLELAGKTAAALACAYPDAACELNFRNPLQVLVATVLSAQCTDRKVNEVTPALFKKYPDASAFAAARVSEVEKLIRSIGLYRAKAKNIVAACRLLVSEHGGAVPQEMEELVRLPGVGRKTANCVRVNAFALPGLMCDTHCCRVTARLGLHRETSPERIETALARLLPESEWGAFSHRVIIHGRRICHARKPDCGNCPLAQLCRWPRKTA